jgi:Flp pilus assembly protein TadG
MIRATHRLAPATRRAGYGVVFAEFAVFMSLLLIPLMAGTWEVGRAVQVQQMVATAAREGARLAAQGRTIGSTGTQAQIMAAILPAANTGNLPNVKAAVMQSLSGSGLTALKWNDVTVNFAFTSGNTGYTDPYQGDKSQLFRVEVIIPYDDRVRWINTGATAMFNITTLRSETRWQMLVDDPFAVNTTLPPW